MSSHSRSGARVALSSDSLPTCTRCSDALFRFAASAETFTRPSVATGRLLSHAIVPSIDISPSSPPVLTAVVAHTDKILPSTLMGVPPPPPPAGTVEMLTGGDLAGTPFFVPDLQSCKSPRPRLRRRARRFLLFNFAGEIVRPEGMWSETIPRRPAKLPLTRASTPFPSRVP